MAQKYYISYIVVQRINDVAQHFKIKIMAFLGRNVVLVYILRERKVKREKERER